MQDSLYLFQLKDSPLYSERRSSSDELFTLADGFTRLIDILTATARMMSPERTI
jgi:hypothetical protein